MSKPPLRILVCGGRMFTDTTRLEHELDDLLIIHGVMKVVTGLAAGADIRADNWAERRKIPRRGYKIKRPSENGFQRNQRMLNSEPIDLVVAFPGGEGTADMVRRACHAGIPVKEIQ